MGENLKRYYPNILVGLQFGIIGLMIIFADGFFSSFYPLLVFVVGAGLGIWALRHNQLGNFNIQPKLKENAKLVTSGIYRYIRHPMYLSVIVMMLSMVIASFSILEVSLFLGLIVVLWLKAKREESLWCMCDDRYIDYKKKTKFFLPFIL